MFGAVILVCVVELIMKSYVSVDDKRVRVTEYVQCTTECGLEAGDQSAARLAQLMTRALFSTLKGAVRPITTSSMHLQHPTRIK